MDIHSRLQTLDYVVIAAYLLMLLTIGIVVSYRRRHEQDQFLAGRSFGWFNVGLSIFGTNVSPSFLIAMSSAAYATGIVTANFEWLAWPFLMLLAMVFAPHYLHMQIGTMPQFVRRRFGPRPAELLSWYALFTTVILWLSGTLYAGSVLLSQILACPLWLSVLMLMSVSAFLTVAGGLAVVMVTDSFQAILMLVGTAIMAWIGLEQVGGIGQLLKEIPAERWQLLRPASDPDFPWHAMLLGYPVMGVWFWCTDQTIVQRILGARDINQGQQGALFAGWLKTLSPVLFLLPGLCCYVLYPNLEDPDMAFTTMVTSTLPPGMVGVMVAVLIAAMISTLDSGLNSFSTIFTLDVYQPRFSPQASPEHLKTVGRLVTLAIAIVAAGIAVLMDSVGKNLFDLLQGLIAYFAPPMTALFLIGILWRRATSSAAFWTLICGSLVSLTLGTLDLLKEPIAKNFGWEISFPHYLLMSFYLFVGIGLFMIVVSLLTRNDPCEERLPPLRETTHESGASSTTMWTGWAILACVMLGIYVAFR